ncbi:MAG: hypothetical protein JKY94_03205 [Rhodobacteraceae bacterium]|nr:hypothetical protein [Paracoccaceae bacterium]
MKFWFLGAVGVFLLGAVMILLQLHPPGTLKLAAGPSGGAYNQVAERYREILARDGIELEIIETAGSAENAQMIANGQVDAAIMQGGVAIPNPEIEAIGAIFFEPMVFLIGPHSNVPGNPAIWKNLHINIGAPGSGTAAAFHDFEAAIGLSRDANFIVGLRYDLAVEALLDGSIDIAVFVAPIDAPYLIAAYSEPSVRLRLLSHAEAISRRLEYAKTVTVPSGAISLDPVIPPGPRLLMALEARLVIRPELHPALVNRLTMAAIELHSGRGLIRDQGMFPTVEGTGLPVNNAARQLIVNGPSIWHDWLPYWMASQVHRLILLMLPILFLLVPALRALPQLYAYLMRWRVWQYYPEIHQIEVQLSTVTDGSELADMDAQLVNLDKRLARIRLPVAYRETAYEFRVHIGLVRHRIEEIRAGKHKTGTA